MWSCTLACPAYLSRWHTVSLYPCYQGGLLEWHAHITRLCCGWCRVGAWAAVTAPQTNEKMPRNTIAVYLTPKLVPVAEAVAKEEVQPPLGSPVPPQAVQPRQQQVHG